jgi:hypothetical protein
VLLLLLLLQLTLVLLLPPYQERDAHPLLH